MKRVLAVLLCLLCALFLLVACGDNNTDTDTDGSKPNTNNQGHVHTYETNEAWTKDAQGHRYDATCECEDAPITKLNHTDANNDGACDVCTFTNHEHEYTEDWTADCTNHWNAADCGHTVAGANVAPHEDKDEDGRCDVCNYIIEDLHQHIYATEWTSGEGYHWHAALCEHKVEVADKAACNVNAAGVCTVCDAVIKEIDRTDILAVLNAAIANNHKVIDGNVTAAQIVYGGSKGAYFIEAKGTNEVFFVLGKNDSYVFWKSFDANDNFVGGDHQWYQGISADEVFAVQMPANSYELEVVAGDGQFLNGYTYQPGSILAAGYEDTTTLAQTIANFYDLMLNGENVSNAVTNYDAEKGVYTFSYEHFSVNSTVETDPNTGDKVTRHQVYLYYVDVEFRVDENFVINVCDFTVESYRNWEADNDITYDPETNTITMNAGANPTVYAYSVSQSSGERTYTTPYPKASLMPIDFDLYHVTDIDTTISPAVIEGEELIVDVDGDGIVDLTLDKETFTRLHLGALIPSSAIASALDINDFEVTCENLDEGNGLLWGTGFMQTPDFNGYIDCVVFRTSANSGKYLLTIRFGQVTKQVCVTIPGTPTLVVPDDTADTKYVVVTDTNAWADEYTFTAPESGKYTFTIPANLGFAVAGENNAVSDPFNPGYVAQAVEYEVDLAKGETLTFNVGATTKGVYAIGVAFEAGEVEDPNPDTPVVPDEPVEIDIIGTYVGSNITVVIDDTNATFTSKGYSLVARHEIKDGKVVLHNDTYGTIWSSSILAVNLTNGKVTSVVYNGTNYTVTEEGEDSGDDGEETLEGSGTDADPYVIPNAGDYVCAFPGQSDVVWYKYTVKSGGYVTVSTTFGNGGWIKLGTNVMTAASNEGNGESLSAYFKAGTVVYIGVGDYGESTTDVPFKLAFQAVTSDSIDGVVGTWSAESTTMYGVTVTYLLTINADGTGTLVYNDGFGDTSCTLDYVLVEGTKLTVGYTSSYSTGSLVCTIGEDTLDCQSGVNNEQFTFTQGAGEDDDDEEESSTVLAGGTVVEGENWITVTADDKLAGTFTLTFVATKTTEYKFTSGALFISKVTGPDGDIAKVDYMYTLTEGVEYTLTISLFLVGTPGDYDIIITTPNYVEPELPNDDTAAVNGYYGLQSNGLYLMIYENDGVFDTIDGGYVAQFFDDDWNTILYFAVTATANGDGTYTLALTYVSRPDYENGTDRVDSILAQTYVISMEAEGGDEGDDTEQAPTESLVGVEGTLNGNNVSFVYDGDANVYYLNVWGGTQDLFYTAVPTENADGSISLALTLCEDHWSYWGSAVTDEYALTGATVVATPSGDSWTYSKDGEYVGPVVPSADGSFANPFDLEASNVCAFPGGMNYKFYKYTATESGVLTVTITSADFYWGYGPGEYSLETVGSANATAQITLAAGEVVYIGVSTNSTNAGEITFTSSFEANGAGTVVEQGTFENPFDLAESNSCDFPGGLDYVFYKYTAAENGTLTITFVSSDRFWAYGANQSALKEMSNKETGDITLVAGEVVYIGISTYSANPKVVEFTSSFASGNVEEEIKINQADLVMGNNSVNAANIAFNYTAAADIKLNITVGNPAMGAVTVTYSINGGTEITLAASTTTEIALSANDKLTITAMTSAGYMTIKAEEVVEQQGPSLEGSGTSADPYVITELPYDIVYTGKHDKNYIFTATEDIVLTVTCPAGCYVTNDKNVTNAGGVYVFTLAAGESVTLNVWTMSSEVKEYTYSVTGAAPQAPEQGGGEASSADGVYVGSCGRNYQVTIDNAAGTITIIRSDLSGYFTTGGATTYTAHYSFDGTTVTYDGTYAMEFDENGAPTKLTWGTQTVTEFVKQ